MLQNKAYCLEFSFKFNETKYIRLLEN